MSLIRIENLSKVYSSGEEDVYALKNIYFSIEEGELVSIVGTSGSGKSTLMTILGCMSTASSGSYFFSGEDLTKKKDDYLTGIRANEIGYIFQEFNLLPDMTALENVMLPLYYRASMYPKQLREKGMECLEMVGLGDRGHHRPGELSGGQRQRVAIARALIMNPKIIIGDEPTGNLDEDSTVQVLGILQHLNQIGKTIIVVTHDEIVAEHCHRIITIKSGQIVKDRVNDQPTLAPNPFGMGQSQVGLRTQVEKNKASLFSLFPQLLSSTDPLIQELPRMDPSEVAKLIHHLAHSAPGRQCLSKNSEILKSHPSWEARLAYVQVLKHIVEKNQLQKESMDFLRNDSQLWVQFYALKNLYDEVNDELLQFSLEKFSDLNEKILATLLSFFSVHIENIKNREGLHQLILKCFESHDPRVVANAVEAYGALGRDGDFTDHGQLLALLDSEHNRVKGNVLLLLWKGGKVHDRCMEELKKLICSENTVYMQTGLFVIEQILQETFVEELVDFIHVYLEKANEYSIQSLLDMMKRLEKKMSEESWKKMVGVFQSEKFDQRAA